MFGSQILVGNTPYALEGRIGRGLYSIVYGGRDLRTGRSVAIKLISFAPDITSVSSRTSSRQQSFWKELQMLLYLQPLNPYVIRVLNHDYNDQYGIIVMERGVTLRDTLLNYGFSGAQIPLPLVKRFWSQMVEAIYYMHQIGFVHGDCKPENFIQVGPGGTILKLIDMGISFHLPSNATSSLHTAAGTPDYVAPEMVNSRHGSSARSRFGYKADIWALGIILFEMAFGFRPLQNLGGNRTKLRFIGRLKTNISIPNHPDRNLRDVLKGCLRPDPRRRFKIEQLLNHPFLTRGI